MYNFLMPPQSHCGGYDANSQLTSETRPGYSAAYTYDSNGNRTTKTLNGVVENYSYDLGDKMLTAGSKSYSYDAAGRTIRVTGPSGITNLAYDEESRLTSVTGAGGNHSYTYNGLDTRMSKTANGMTTQFHRDGAYVTDPVIWDSGATYTPGISERRSNATRYLHSGLKNATAQSDASQTIAATRQYDAFGMVTSQTGNWSGPFGYAGGFGYQEDETGLRLLGHRYYDPSTGRFLTRDPIMDGRNWYSYCNNNPITGTDADGLKPRNLSAEEREAVSQAINDLRNNGEAEAADDLQALLDAGKILADDENDDYATRVDDEIHIGKGGLDLISESKSKNQNMEASRKGKRIEFASHLLHEWVHLMKQDGVKGRSQREIGAYVYQELFLKRYYAKLMSKKHLSQFNQKVASYIKSLLKELHKQRRDYSGGS